MYVIYVPCSIYLHRNELWRDVNALKALSQNRSNNVPWHRGFKLYVSNWSDGAITMPASQILELISGF